MSVESLVGLLNYFSKASFYKYVVYSKKMLHLKALFFTVLLPATVWAVDYSKLDHLQYELLADYQKTIEIAGAPRDIRQSLKNKEDKKVLKSIIAIEDFFTKYDQYNMLKIDLFMSNALVDVRAKYLQTKSYIDKKSQKRLKNSLTSIETSFHGYGVKKINFGKANDFERVVAGRDFFIEIGKFSNLLKEALGGEVNRIWGVELLPFIDNGKEFLPLTSDFLKLLYSSYFQTKKNKPNQAPIIDSLRNISQHIAKNRLTRTKWFGLENMGSMPLDGKTINVFAFMHANSYFDTSVQGTLKLDGLSSIGNVDVVFPEFLAKRMVKSDHIITVGHGDTMAKTKNLIQTKQLNKFFVAPEGLTPVGFYEMRPLVDVFTESMYAMIESGLKINLYPVSFPENFRFMNDYRRPVEGDLLAYGIIHPHLDTQDLVQLLNVTKNKQAAAQLIRWIWFSDLNNDTDHDMGMPKPTQMKVWFDAMVWGNL